MKHRWIVFAAAYVMLSPLLSWAQSPGAVGTMDGGMVGQAIAGTLDTRLASLNATAPAALGSSLESGGLHVGWIRADVDGDGVRDLVVLADSDLATVAGSVAEVVGGAPRMPLAQQRFVTGETMSDGPMAAPRDITAPPGPMEPSFKHGTTLIVMHF